MAVARGSSATYIEKEMATVHLQSKVGTIVAIHLLVHRALFVRCKITYGRHLRKTTTSAEGNWNRMFPEIDPWEEYLQREIAESKTWRKKKKKADNIQRE